MTDIKEYWHKMDTPPEEGRAVYIYTKNNTLNIAYYCMGSFFKMEYDPRLGVMRKEYVSDEVAYWADITVPSIPV